MILLSIMRLILPGSKLERNAALCEKLGAVVKLSSLPRTPGN